MGLWLPKYLGSILELHMFVGRMLEKLYSKNK